MSEFVLNRHELSQYGLLLSQVAELDKKIQDTEDELSELNRYNISVSPVLTGMPRGNEKRDKIADFIIQLEKDRKRLKSEVASLKADRDVITYRLKKIRDAVNKIPNKYLKDIIIWHYIDGLCVKEIAEKECVTENAVYKKISRFHKFGSSHSG